MERFGQYFKVKKKISIVFSKCDFAGGEGGPFSLTKKILKKPNIPKYSQNLVVTWAKPNSVTAHVSPPPSTSQNVLWKEETKGYLDIN